VKPGGPCSAGCHHQPAWITMKRRGREWMDGWMEYDWDWSAAHSCSVRQTVRATRCVFCAGRDYFQYKSFEVQCWHCFISCSAPSALSKRVKLAMYLSMSLLSRFKTFIRHIHIQDMQWNESLVGQLKSRRGRDIGYCGDHGGRTGGLRGASDVFRLFMSTQCFIVTCTS